jgi:hypothetical protein
MKRMLYLGCGICWFAFGAGFGLFLLQYVTDGAGWQDLGPRWLISSQAVTSGSVLVGFVHAAGLFALSALCFLVGIGLCLCGLHPRAEDEPDRMQIGS